MLYEGRPCRSRRCTPPVPTDAQDKDSIEAAQDQNDRSILTVRDLTRSIKGGLLFSESVQAKPVDKSTENPWTLFYVSMRWKTS